MQNGRPMKRNTRPLITWIQRTENIINIIKNPLRWLKLTHTTTVIIFDNPTVTTADSTQHQITINSDVVPSRNNESRPLRIQSNHTINRTNTNFPTCEIHFTKIGDHPPIFLSAMFHDLEILIPNLLIHGLWFHIHSLTFPRTFEVKVVNEGKFSPVRLSSFVDWLRLFSFLSVPMPSNSELKCVLSLIWLDEGTESSKFGMLLFSAFCGFKPLPNFLLFLFFLEEILEDAGPSSKGFSTGAVAISKDFVSLDGRKSFSTEFLYLVLEALLRMLFFCWFPLRAIDRW